MLRAPPTSLRKRRTSGDHAPGLTTSGGLVSAWADQSSNGHNASQGTAGQQAQLVYDAIGGHPALSFNGSNFYNLAGQVLT